MFEILNLNDTNKINEKEKFDHNKSDRNQIKIDLLI